MKKYLLILIPILILILLIPAFPVKKQKSTPKPKVLVQKGPFKVKLNKEFKILLDSNPTTGYQWSITKIDQNLIKPVKSIYVAPKKPKIGQGGKQEFTFLTLKTGKTELELQYLRSWENPPNPAKLKKVRIFIIK